jgi:hypothetical protein
LQALILSLLDHYFHVVLVEAFLGLEARAEIRIRIAEHGLTVALLRPEALAPSFFQQLR